MIINTKYAIDEIVYTIRTFKNEIEDEVAISIEQIKEIRYINNKVLYIMDSGICYDEKDIMSKAISNYEFVESITSRLEENN